jgi:hypothetical protein
MNSYIISRSEYIDYIISYLNLNQRVANVTHLLKLYKFTSLLYATIYRLQEFIYLSYPDYMNTYSQ